MGPTVNLMKLHSVISSHLSYSKTAVEASLICSFVFAKNVEGRIVFLNFAKDMKSIIPDFNYGQDR